MNYGFSRPTHIINDTLIDTVKGICKDHHQLSSELKVNLFFNMKTFTQKLHLPALVKELSTPSL